MPSTEQLTAAVLRVDDYKRNDDENFERLNSGKNNSWADEKVVLQFLLRNLDDRCKDYFKKSSVNYEDIFFAASQLEEHLLGEYENPAIEPLVEALLDDLRLFLLCTPSIRVPMDSHPRPDLGDRARLACRYIRSVVILELRRVLPFLNHLTCLVDAIKDPEVDSCHIITLNHDLLIEKVLQEHSLAFVDGFEKPEKGIAQWDKNALENPSCRYLLKLHGSIDWVDRPGKVPVKVLGNWERLRDEKGDLLFREEPDPMMLVGTFNKIRDYYGTPYFDLAAAFRRLLTTFDWLIISGYSFGDKGINTALSEWLDFHRSAKILVLDKKGAQCLDGARGAIRKRKERMQFYDSYLCASKWEDLKRTYIFPDLSQ
jgi:hypothetical protein